MLNNTKSLGGFMYETSPNMLKTAIKPPVVKPTNRVKVKDMIKRGSMYNKTGAM